MGATKRLVKLTAGGLIGAALGSVTVTLLTPQSGNELQRRVRDRLLQAKLAGVTAKAEKEEELIRRFRGSVNDPNALEDERVRAHAEATEAVQAVEAGGNASGTIAPKEFSPPRS